MKVLRIAAVAALTLNACASPADDSAGASADSFTSNRLTVTTRGDGPDIILVPGLASHRDVWAPVADSSTIVTGCTWCT